MQKAELSEKAKEARREYHRKWRKENPEKYLANVKRYWERQASQMEGQRLNQ